MRKFKLAAIFLLMAIVLCTASAFATTWNLRDGDWSTVNSDTTDPWAVGEYANGALTLYQYSTVNQNAFGTYGSVGYNWDGGGDWDNHGNIGKNTSDSQPINAWTAYWDPQDMVGGAGVNGGLTSVEFTAPESGKFALNAVFSGKSTKGGGATVDCYLYVNGVQVGTVKELRGQVQSADGNSGPQGTAPQVVFDNVLDLNAGDTVLVGFNGSSDGIAADATGVEFEISTVSSIATLTGTVKSDQNAPIAGATVTVGAKSATTDANGVYTVEFSEGGNGTVTASADGFFPASADASWVVGETTTLNFVLETRAPNMTWYVDGNGDNSNDGRTPETAFGSFSRAAKFAAPGDTVIGNGQFGSKSIDNFKGTADAWITIKASEDGCTIVGANDYPVAATMYDDQYLKIEGITFQGGIKGIDMARCSNCEIAFCTFQDINVESRGEGCGVWNSGSSNIYYHNNIFRHVSQPNTGPQGCIVFVLGSYDCQVYNNTFVYASNALRAWRNVGRIAVKNNIIVDMYGGGGNGYIHCDGGENCDNAFNCDTNLFYASSGNDVTLYDNNSTHSNDLTMAPSFVNYAAFDDPDCDFNLTSYSPAINAGVDVGLPYNASAPDLGALESEYTGSEVAYIEGYVTRSANKYYAAGTPLRGARIVSGTDVAITDTDGYYKLAVAPGTHDVTCSFGLNAENNAQTESVFVDLGQTAQQNFELTALVGNTYYVSTEGDDWTGDGSQENPWASLDTGDAWEVLLPGDTIIVQEGTYFDPDDVLGYKLMNVSGDEMAPVTYVADGAVVIDGSYWTDQHVDEMTNCIRFGGSGTVVSGIVMDGFEFVGAQFGIYLCDGSNQNMVTDCYFHDFLRPAENDIHNGVSDTVAGLVFSISNDCIAKNNIFANINDPRGWSYGIGMPINNRTKIINNTFDNCDWAVRSWAGGGNNEFVNNIVMNMEEGGFLVDSNFITAKNNLFYNVAGSVFGNAIDGGDNFLAIPGLDENYAPVEGSLAADAGIETGYAYEGAAPDLGAIESQFTAVPYSQVVSGVAVNTDNEPLSGVAITFDDAFNFTSGSNGNFIQLPYRAAGTSVKVDATKEGYSDYSETYTLSGDTDVTVVMEFLQAYVTGTVTEAGTGAPVAGATVAITGGASTTTNSAGQYTLMTPEASVEITVSADCFDPATATVATTLGGSVTQDFELTRNAYLWEVNNDFSKELGGPNPNGVWSYGYETPRADDATSGTAFVPYDAFVDAGNTEIAWRHGGDWDNWGYVGYRRGDGVHNEWGHWRLPHTVYLGSSFGSGWSTVRFTAPFAGDFNFEIKFQYAGSGGNGAMVYLDHNGTTVESKRVTGSIHGGQAEDENNTYATQFTLHMAAGDTLDLVDNAFTAAGSCSVLPLFKVTADVPSTDYVDVDSAEALENAEVGDLVNTTFTATALNGSDAFADGSVYIESGLFEGYKLIVPASAEIAAGDAITFKGEVKSDADGKYVEVAEITSKTAGEAGKIVGMTNDMLDSNVPVRAWGKVVSVSGDTFVMNNGNGDVTVKVEKAAAPAVGDFVTLTGVATQTGIRAIEILK